ncbi:MAG: energy-coupling factor ABC transporter ATP-binding protein [Acetobacteraceae bacterium]|nr:energy-coupling factor ABC transporter ATP-binding protein [Acetobacteraceae bacterium]
MSLQRPGGRDVPSVKGRPPEAQEIARVSCVRHFYPDRTQVYICGLDFVLYAGERVVLLGPNGAGKTTLLLHLMGFLRPAEGLVRVFGLEPYRDFERLRRRLGVVFQRVEEQIIGPTVRDDIAFGLLGLGWRRDRAAARVEEIAARLRIEGLLGKIPHYLSYGEQKKVALAGALAGDPELLILDEPFEGLDPRSRGEMARLLLDLNREKGTALLFSTHDPGLVPGLAERVYVMGQGRILASGRPDQVFWDERLLREAGLEPPPLVEVFRPLLDAGLPVGRPLSAGDAVQRLLRAFWAARVGRSGAVAVEPDEE